MTDAEAGGVMDSRPWWRRWLPEPFWPTLLALLMLAIFGAIPFWILGALIWPDTTGSTSTPIFAAGYVLGIPLTWWLLRERETAMTTIESLRRRRAGEHPV